MCKNWLKNSYPFGKKCQKTAGGDFFWLTLYILCTVHRITAPTTNLHSHRLTQSSTDILKPMTHLKVSWEGHLHKKLSQENKKTCTSYLQKFYMTHLQVEQRKMQVKSGVSWALLCCDSDWPITAHRLWKKTSRNRTRSISESWLSQV